MLRELKSELKGKFYQILFLSYDNKNVGGALYYLKKEKNIHLWYIYINKEFRNCGYSKILLDEIEKRIKKTEANVITTFVSYKNNKALVLFIKHNYKIFGFLFDKKLLMLKKKLIIEKNYL